MTADQIQVIRDIEAQIETLRNTVAGIVLGLEPTDDYFEPMNSAATSLRQAQGELSWVGNVR